MLSNELCAGSPRTKIEMIPSSCGLPLASPLAELSSRRSTRNSEPHEPRAANSGSWLVGASVSPVGLKKNVRNFESGSQARFSGRLNGVAPAALAATVALNVAVSPAFDSWMVTHLMGHDVP